MNGRIRRIKRRMFPGRVAPEIAEALRPVIAGVRHREQVSRDSGSRFRTRGYPVLFVGRAGTGKTMAAEVIANTLGLDLYRVDLSAVVSKYIGETEKNLSRIFDSAETAGAVLFFDEADALFGKRTDVQDANDRHANMDISYLLQRIEGYGGIVILAINRGTHIDEAFKRRFAHVVNLPEPAPGKGRRIRRE